MRAVVPLFPLPRILLFPGVVLPLHIFEERYKAMVEDSLDGPGRIVVGTVLRGREGDMEGSPPVYPVAGLGEIGRHQRLDDGGFHVWLVGLKRIHLREVESDKPYRLVEITAAPDIEVPVQREAVLRKKLVSAILERTTGLATIPPNVHVSHLADLLILRMNLPSELLTELFGEVDTEQRALRALAEHGERPLLDGPDDAEPDAGRPD